MADVEINHGALELILGMLGITDPQAWTDQPLAILHLSFKRYGKPVKIDLSLLQIIEQVTGQTPAPGAPPGDDPGPAIDIGLKQ